MKLTKKHWLAGSLLMGLVLTGCGKEDEEEGSSLLSSDTLEGEWVGDCRAVGSQYSKTSYEFVGKTFTYTSASYADAACSQEQDVIFGRGTYAITGETSDDDGTALTKVDFTYVTFTWTFTADPSAAVDWAVACGGASQANGTVNVLGQTCTVGDFTLTFAAQQYGTMASLNSKLHVTDVNSNGTTEETRSKAINKETGGLTKTAVETAE